MAIDLTKTRAFARSASKKVGNRLAYLARVTKDPAMKHRLLTLQGDLTYPIDEMRVCGLERLKQYRYLLTDIDCIIDAVHLDSSLDGDGIHRLYEDMFLLVYDHAFFNKV